MKTTLNGLYLALDMINKRHIAPLTKAEREQLLHLIGATKAFAELTGGLVDSDFRRTPEELAETCQDGVRLVEDAISDPEITMLMFDRVLPDGTVEMLSAWRDADQMIRVRKRGNGSYSMTLNDFLMMHGHRQVYETYAEKRG